MTPRQQQYARFRGEGLGQAQAALKAGYSASSAKVIASRMERLPEIRAAIDKARQNPPNSSGAAIEYENAEDYLLAVVRGTAVPDPIRVAAARAILPFQRAKQRAPIKAHTPRELQHREALESEAELLEAWARKAEAVRQRLARERARKL